MTRHTRITLATVCVLSVLGAVPSGHSASRGDAPTLTRTVVLDGLHSPWDLAFTPDGALLFTEKCRGLSVRRADGTVHHLLGRDGAATAAPDFFCEGQSGAYGVAVDPQFARTRFVYLFMPSTLPRPPTNRTFRPGTGQPFVAEHGPNHSDEVTPLVAGGNGGWDPQPRPHLRCPDGYCGYAGTATTMPMTDTTRFPDALRPSWTNGGTSEGMGPSTFLTGAQWGAWEGRLAVGFLAGQRIEVLHLDEAGMTTSHTRMDLPRQRIRALVPDPTGDLYIAVDAGAIWRIAPRAP